MSTEIKSGEIEIRDTEYTCVEAGLDQVYTIDNSSGSTIFELDLEYVKGQGDEYRIKKDGEVIYKIGQNLKEIGESDGNWIIYSVIEDKVLGSIELSLSGTGYVEGNNKNKIIDFDRDRIPQMIRAYIPLTKFFINQEWIAKVPGEGKVGKIEGNTPIFGSPKTRIKIDDPNNLSALEFVSITGYLAIQSFGGV